MRKISKKIVAGALAFALATGSIFYSPFKINPVAADTSYKLNNPQLGSIVTWDCVYFGNYPQKEITFSDNSELYNTLMTSENWDNNELVLGGVKYRRIQKSDAASTGNHFDWSNEYHYYQYSKIKWRVLNCENSKIMLLSDKALDMRQYNTIAKRVSWENSTLRSWLNGYDADQNISSEDYNSNSFINTAFTDAERNIILQQELSNPASSTYSVSTGNNTSAKVFIMSEGDLKNSSYGFSNERARQLVCTDYANGMGAAKPNVSYWSRTQGKTELSELYVKEDGSLYTKGYSVAYNSNAVRVAIVIDAAGTSHYSYAGTVASDGSVYEIETTSQVETTTTEETTSQIETTTKEETSSQVETTTKETTSNEESSSQVETTTIEETTSQIETTTTDETASQVETTTTDETTSQVETTTTEETASQVETTTTTDETTSQVETTTTEETTSQVETTTIDETTSQVETTTIDETTSQVETTTIDETTSQIETTTLEEVTTPEETTTKQATDSLDVGDSFYDNKSKAMYTVTMSSAKSGNMCYDKYCGGKKSVKIPDSLTVDGKKYTVTSIAANCFKNNTAITKVSIGHYVRVIGANAFYGCKQLKSITFGKRVTTIGSKAFYRCTAVKKIVIPKSITKIGEAAFGKCKKLKKISILNPNLKPSGFGKNAFRETYKKPFVMIPIKNYKNYKSILLSKCKLSKKTNIVKSKF